MNAPLRATTLVHRAMLAAFYFAAKDMTRGCELTADDCLRAEILYNARNEAMDAAAEEAATAAERSEYARSVGRVWARTVQP